MENRLDDACRINTRNHIIRRFTSILALLLCIAATHWYVPLSGETWHGVHIVLRKLFIVPVVLGAVYFGLRGAAAFAAMATALYLPYVLLEWQGELAENLNQLGEVFTFWIVAVVAGVLVARERKTLQDLALSNEGALIAMVNALDAREHDTQLHSLRVRAYALRLAEELGDKSIDWTSLAQGALLHDVGKIGVPDAILLKPGTLNEDEWREMRKHPTIGRQILESISFLSDASEIVYAHHERFDGQGYPRRLGGTAIPLGARIFAVVDAFDALTSKRPYQDSMGYEEAVARISEGSGSHFDPAIVDAFLRISPETWESLARRTSQLSISPEYKKAPSISR